MIDVFKVGVHIGMTTNSAQVLSVLLSQLTGVHIAAGKVSSALGKMRNLAIGVGSAFAGWEIAKGLIAATKHAEKLNHELVKLQTGARLTDKQTDDARVDAFRITRAIPGSTADEVTKMRRELFGVFGNMDEANSTLPLITQGSLDVRRFTDVQGVDLAKVAMKALELRGHLTKDGKVSEAEFGKEFNAMVRSIVASEGLVTPETLYAAIKQAGPAARLMNGDEFWGKFPAIINAMGGDKSGTALFSLFSQLVGHVVAGKRVALAEERAGMLTKGKWRVGRGGKVEMDQDATPDQAGFMDHPLTWMHEKLEAMRKQKDKNGKPIDMVGVIQEIFQLSSRQTSARLISDIDANWPIIQNEEARFKRMPNVAGIAKEQNDKDLSVNVQNLAAAWTNFTTALGGPGIPIAIAVLHKLTDALNYMQAAVIAHPALTSDLFALAAGISALTMLGGGLAILNACWRPLSAGLGLIVGVPGLAATGVALGGLAAGLTALGAALAGLPPLLKWLADWALGGAAHGSARGGGRGGTSTAPGNGLSYDLPDLPGPGGPARGGGRGSSHGNEIDRQKSGDVYLDGKKVGMIMREHLADDFSRPMTGGRGADSRLTPVMPGMATAYG